MNSEEINRIIKNLSVQELNFDGEAVLLLVLGSMLSLKENQKMLMKLHLQLIHELRGDKSDFKFSERVEKQFAKIDYEMKAKMHPVSIEILLSLLKK